MLINLKLMLFIINISIVNSNVLWTGCCSSHRKGSHVCDILPRIDSMPNGHHSLEFRGSCLFFKVSYIRNILPFSIVHDSAPLELSAYHVLHLHQHILFNTVHGLLFDTHPKLIRLFDVVKHKKI